MANGLINRSYRKKIDLIGRVKIIKMMFLDLGLSILLMLSTQCFL